MLWQVSAEAEPLADRGTAQKASMTGSVANRRWRGIDAFRSGLLRADGQIAVSLADGAGGQELIRLSDPATGRSSGRPATHYPGWIARAVAFSPDGRCFATGSNPDDRRQQARSDSGTRARACCESRRFRTPTGSRHWHSSPMARFWPRAITMGSSGSGIPRPGEEIGRPLPQGEIVLSLAYSPDGTMIAVGLASERGKSGTRLWDTRTRQPIGELLPSNEHVTRIEFRPDGRALLASSTSIR